MSAPVRRRLVGAMILGAIAVVGGVVHANAPPGQYVSFTSSDACISDQETKLEWMRAPFPSAYDYLGANGACASLNDDAGTGVGWRVPSVNELETLVDDVPFCEDVLTPGGGCIVKAIDGYAFPQTPATQFWTSSSVPGTSPVYAWTVNFADGSSHQALASAPNLVRCVATWVNGNPPACPVQYPPTNP